jgi:hypothetical protein
VIPIAIPMALGLTLGILIADSGGDATTIDQSVPGVSAHPPSSAWASSSATSRAAPDRPVRSPAWSHSEQAGGYRDGDDS